MYCAQVFYFTQCKTRDVELEKNIYIFWKPPKKVTIVDEVSATWTPTKFKLCAVQGTKVANSLRRKMCD